MLHSTRSIVAIILRDPVKYTVRYNFMHFKSRIKQQFWFSGVTGISHFQICQMKRSANDRLRYPHQRNPLGSQLNVIMSSKHHNFYRVFGQLKIFNKFFFTVACYGVIFLCSYCYNRVYNLTKWGDRERNTKNINCSKL